MARPARHPWRGALVTGASAGIGAAFALELARRGTDVVLVARRADRLDEVAGQVRALGAEAEVLVADLGDDAGCAAVEARLRDRARPVDLLVNNAGFGTSGRFWELPVERELAEVDLNVRSLVRLTHAALGVLVAEGRGAVCNVSSIAGNQPGPTQAVYGATKAFVTLFSEALALETAATGVTVTAVLPGLTHTEFHEVAGIEDEVSSLPGFVWMSADEVARRGLDDTAAGKVLSVPGALNKTVSTLSSMAPRGLRRVGAAATYKRLR